MIFLFRSVSDHIPLLFITILGHSDRAGIALGLFFAAWTFLLIIAHFIVFFYLLSCLHPCTVGNKTVRMFGTSSLFLE